MPGYIVVEGDLLQISIDGAFVEALAGPISLRASGTSTVNGLRVCVAGDECPAELRGPLSYLTEQFPVPGLGTIAFPEGGPGGYAANFTDATGALLLTEEAPLLVTFTVVQPASNPADPRLLLVDQVETKIGSAVILSQSRAAWIDP